MPRRSLTQALFPRGLMPHEPCVAALCGGGGKTTLMYALARELHALGRPVICATTTKLFPPRIPDDVQAVRLAETHDLFSPSLLDSSPVLVADRLLADCGKLAGLSPQTIDALAARFPAAILLVEADGAARKPLKAPLPHEPVFPASTTLAVAVVGLDAVNAPLTPATTHRLEQVCALTGLVPEAPVSLDALTTLATHPHGWLQHCPPGARRVIFGNKADVWPVPADWPAAWLAGSAQEGWCL